MANELQPITTGNLSTTSTIFDDFEEFQKAYKMAEALSKTSLIPQNFQGKPEDCIIAIDYSRRLGLPPTSVMPHLYVIGGRPSISAQFMISLVNRSGKFTRIKWRESINGNVEFTVNKEKKSLPNFSATAYFEEIATGKRYESPTVDVKFAQQNGWLVKRDKYGKDLESGWCKMPGVMARYRSAAILIKTVCPEIALGMEIDAGDGEGEGTSVPSAGSVEEREAPTASPAPRRVDVAIVSNGKSDEQLEKEFFEIRDAIAGANYTQLRFISRHIADAGLPPAYLDELREAYKKRRAELDAAERSQTQTIAPAEAASDVEPEKNDAPVVTPEAIADFERIIGGCVKYPDLTAAWQDVENAMEAGRITHDRYIELQEIYKTAVDVVRATNDEKERELFAAFLKDVNAAEGDKDQKQWAQELARTISSSVDREFIERNNLNTAAEWRESGALTATLYNAVVKYANARLDALF